MLAPSTDFQAPDASAPAANQATLGVYVHFPFCATKCGYCDFLSIPTGADPIPHLAYANAVIAELERRGALLGASAIHSVFFGGGTPSLWDTRELGRVLSAIRQRFESTPAGPEVTVECNPGSFDARVAAGLLEVGVNRISLGVQALNLERLRFLGRGHDQHQGLEAIELALRAGFRNVSGDLLFGVAGQSAEDAAHEAAAVADSGVCHLSAYALTIEPGTRFGELARRGRLALLPDDEVAEAFLKVRATLEQRGFLHYEISNYARPGRESRHNLGYWCGEPYLGLGVGAWGTLGASAHKVRYRNTPSLERYLQLGTELSITPLDVEGPFVAVLEAIGPETDLAECLMLGLRLERGVDLCELQAKTGTSPWTPERKRAFAKWSSRGALSLAAGRLRLEKSHWLMADAIVRELI